MAKELEQTVARRAKRDKIQQKVTLALVRLTAQSGRELFVSEESLLKRLNLNTRTEWKPVYQLRQAVRRLEKKGLVQFEQGPSGWAVRLSKKGEQFAERLEKKERIGMPQTQKWDGRWRIVIFDIWERRRGERDKLRVMLLKAGFYKIQNSVWAYPYDCADLLIFLRADLHLGKSVLYIVAEGIENDTKIREHFNLA